MTPYYSDDQTTLYHGDALSALTTLMDGSVDCIVTSPPYFGLRDYGVDGQIGAESSPAEFVAALVAVFREARRVLADDGTLWLNLGDSYSGGNRTSYDTAGGKTRARGHNAERPLTGIPGKNLLGIPWRVAFALQDDGWILRNDIIWAKPNAMPESVTDRLSTKHEHLFLFSKSRRYWFDLDPIREPHAFPDDDRSARGQSIGHIHMSPATRTNGHDNGRNPGDVWTIPTQPFSEAHFAVFPTEIPRRAIAAGCAPRVCQECGHKPERVVEKGDLVPSRDGVTNLRSQNDAGHVGTAVSERSFAGGGHALPRRERTTTGHTDCGHGAFLAGTVLDPFSGSGTTGLAAAQLGRRYVGIDLNLEYLDLSLRTRLVQPSLTSEAGVS